MAGAGLLLVPAWAAGWSDSSQVTPGTFTAGWLDPPTNMQCSGSGLLTGPTLSWTPPITGATPNQYKVTYRQGSPTGTPTSVPTTSTSWNLPTGLLDLITTYYISVQSSVAGSAWVSAPANPGQKVTVIGLLGVPVNTSCSGTFVPVS
jgi:hypothetical protein